VYTAYDLSIIEGYTENEKRIFKPSQSITRGEIAKVALLSEQ
jgi:hypothetical protein